MRILIFCLASVLAACSYTPNSYEFRQQSTDALVVYELDGTAFILVPIDLEAQTVGRERIRLENGDAIGSQRIAGDFGIKLVPPGAYALVNSLTDSGYSLCLEDRAPAFRVEAGSVHVMPRRRRFEQGYRAYAPSLLDRARGILTLYPGIESEARSVDFIGYIDISEREAAGIFVASCGSGSTFEFLGED